MGASGNAQTVLERWLAIGAVGFPVLGVTIDALGRLKREQERIATAELAQAILRDPLMTLNVLHHLYGHRTKSQTHDITTIAHAIMMLGLQRFFRELSALTAVEDRLGDAPSRLSAVYATASRLRLAALFARDWAAQRHDIDPEEVMVAALVHDCAEMLVACAWQGDAPAFSADELAALRSDLFARLGLPGLLGELTDDGEGLQPRALNVSLACALARCCAEGWDAPRLGELLGRIQRLLHVSEAEAWGRVVRTALQAAREWRYYRTRPAAAYLPMLGPPDRSSDDSDRR